jgi:hypothetical protein
LAISHFQIIVSTYTKQVQMTILICINILERCLHLYMIAIILKAKMGDNILETFIDTIAECWTGIREVYLSIFNVISNDCNEPHTITVSGIKTEYKVYLVEGTNVKAANIFWHSRAEHTPDNLLSALQKETPQTATLQLQGLLVSSCSEEPPRAFRLEIDLNTKCATIYAVPNVGIIGETKECAHHIISIQLNSLSIKDVMKPLLCSAKNKERIRQQRAAVLADVHHN